MNIKQIREEALLTQKEFAEVIGVTLSTVQKWEQNRNSPRIKQKRKLIKFCEENNINYKEK